MATSICELIWLIPLLKDLQIDHSQEALYSVIVKQLYTLQQTLCTMKEPSILNLTVI